MAKTWKKVKYPPPKKSIRRLKLKQKKTESEKNSQTVKEIQKITIQYNTKQLQNTKITRQKKTQKIHHIQKTILSQSANLRVRRMQYLSWQQKMEWSCEEVRWT